MHIKFWVGNLKERRHLEDPEIKQIVLKVLVHAMRSYVGLEVQIYSFLTSALDRGKRLPSR
jgi:fucose permease